MVLLPCWLKGKTIIKQTDPNGIKKGEYCFDCGRPCVGPEVCGKCDEPQCEYGFNIPGLLYYPKLRKKVLDYVFDASLDDELLLAGVVPIRNLRLQETKLPGKVYSKPCFDEVTGKRLMYLDQRSLELYRSHVKAHNTFVATVKNTKPLPPRVILEKKRKL